MSKKRNKAGDTTASQQPSQPATQSAPPMRQNQVVQSRPQQSERPNRPNNQSGRRYDAPQPATQRRGGSFTLKYLAASRWLPLLVVLIIALLPSLYFYHKSQLAEQKNSTPSSTSLQTTAEVVKRVSRHILLPSGEQPTIATVSDASQVRTQAFFANAASGDKVLVYAQAKKAYLYRPSIDRIIEVAPLAPTKTGP